MKKITLVLAAILVSFAVNAQCTDYVDGPYTNFNTSFGGAPQPGAAEDTHQITSFEIWKSEAYLMDGIIAGETYAFSACDGPGAGTWLIDYAVGPNNAGSLSNIDAFGTDADSDCTITFTATASGTYLIIINEVDNCGVAAEVDNGFPTIMIIEELSIEDSNITGFNYFYSPQTKNLTLNASEAFSNISVYNLLGQEVVSSKLSSTNEVINLSSIKNGVYIANVIANGQTTSFKIVKK